jgi:hypothetical protein
MADGPAAGALDQADEYPWVLVARRRRLRRWLWAALAVAVVVGGVVVVQENGPSLRQGALRLPDRIAGLDRGTQYDIEASNLIVQGLEYRFPSAQVGFGLYGDPADRGDHLAVIQIKGAPDLSIEDVLAVDAAGAELKGQRVVPAPPPLSDPATCVRYDKPNYASVICYVRHGAMLTIVELPRLLIDDAVPVFNLARGDLGV